MQKNQQEQHVVEYYEKQTTISGALNYVVSPSGTHEFYKTSNAKNLVVLKQKIKGGNFQFKNNCWLILSAEGVFIAITT